MASRGIIYAVVAYLAWGFLPIYWKWLQHIPSEHILAHRMVWSLLVFILILMYRQSTAAFFELLKNKRTLIISLVTAILIAANWYTYIWAVNSGHIIETSLGYFINPLVSVFLGVLVLKERLRPGQWFAIFAAFSAVVYLAFNVNSLWVSLALAMTFGIYGLIKRAYPQPAVEGMALETSILFIPALCFLVYLYTITPGTNENITIASQILLIFSGLATALPLLWFSISAQLLPLATLGILQYLAPTIQFLIGVFMYHEPFDKTRAVGFMVIWLALIIYTVENIMHRRKSRTTAG